MNWEVGRLYRTRGGRFVRIETAAPLTARLVTEPNTIHSFNSLGECMETTACDLMELVRQQHEADALASAGSVRKPNL